MHSTSVAPRSLVGTDEFAHEMSRSRHIGTDRGELADALQEEAKRRAAAGTFFGHIAYASLSTKKSG